MGQQSAVVLPASAMHVEELGQQKSVGRLAAHWTYDESPHVESRLKISSGDVDVRGRTHTGSWMARADVNDGNASRTATSALEEAALFIPFIEAPLVPFILCLLFRIIVVLVVARGRRVAGRMLCPCWTGELSISVLLCFFGSLFQISPGDRCCSFEVAKKKGSV